MGEMDGNGGQFDMVSLLQETVARGASDLHLVAGFPPLARVDGTVIPISNTVIDADICRGLLFSALTESQRSRLEETWELDFVLEVDGLGRFRANAHYARGNIEGAFRSIPAVIPELEQLGHRPSAVRCCAFEEGLILVTGTTGSGKSTTLASMIQTISRQRATVIVTIEDPIEYLYEPSMGVIKQREVGTDTKSFAAALKHVLRQDPDVIVISEMRDLETIQAAITAAETGHLVIATLHTMDAPKSIDRIVDSFPPEQQNQVTVQLSNCLQAVISQRLLPKTGGKGRVMATETMFANSGVRACIRDRKSHMLSGLIEIGSSDQMNTLDDSLLDLLQRGDISYEEACRNARDPARFSEPKEEKKKGFFR